MSLAFRSGILVWAMSLTCAIVILPTLLLCGSGLPFCTPAARADDEAQGTAEAGEDEAEAEGEDDYDEWDLDQLKAEWAERELGDLPVIRGRNSEARLQAKLIEELRDDDKANPFEA